MAARSRSRSRSHRCAVKDPYTFDDDVGLGGARGEGTPIPTTPLLDPQPGPAPLGVQTPAPVLESSTPSPSPSPTPTKSSKAGCNNASRDPPPDLYPGVPEKEWLGVALMRMRRLLEWRKSTDSLSVRYDGGSVWVGYDSNNFRPISWWA